MRLQANALLTHHFVLEAVVSDKTQFYNPEWVFDESSAIVSTVEQYVVKIDTNILTSGNSYTIDFKLTDLSENINNFYYIFYVTL